ncbi:MAG: endopeptidase La [Bacteroidales bacterium]|jgi:ATP-dependent Lon protease|nr:endopeptidase La [Bacteroidales bacterium]
MTKKINFLSGEEALQDLLQADSGIIPLISEEESEDFFKTTLPDQLAILPLRNTVMLPGVVMPITTGREKSRILAEHAYQNDRLIGIITQLDERIEDPHEKDLYKVGTLSRIIKMFDMPDGVKTILVQGLRPFRLTKIFTNEPFLQGFVAPYPTNDFDKRTLHSKEFNALISSLLDVTSKILKTSYAPFSEEALSAFRNIENRIFIVNFLLSNMHIGAAEKQRIFEMQDITERVTAVLTEQNKALQMAQLKAQIQKKTKIELDKQQKEYFLNQQMKTIQEELGNTGVEQAVIELQKKAENKKWDEDTKTYFERELHKLQRMNQMSPDYTNQLNYLELLVDLPWNEYTKDNLDLKSVAKILDEDHFGLDKIKQRIIEYLAVLKLKGDMKSPILCFVGPPGVGKTSLGKSVARAMDRKYIRISLGGMRDESEIRGHRKTYIGALPGRIVQSIRKAGSSNPVFMLDEIDKLSGMNVQGDPSAAMLEVLDPEQNTTFYDNYLETTYDLSRVMFIATANNINTIHPALLDRMEVIELSSYILEEKMSIAKRHLIPRQIAEHGLKEKDIHFEDEHIQKIISDYTREAGVRILEKQLAKVIRNRAAQIAEKKKVSRTLKDGEIEKILGVPLYKRENDASTTQTGIAVGLAWTPVGGEVLFVETATSEGKGDLVLTGNLGNVMKESATIAYQYIKVHAADFDLNVDEIQKKDVYIHVPEGATPKDGPSAGITILTALLSTFSNKTIRSSLAMTGEITLRGKLMPVGGIREKILAAKRAKIKTIVLPKANENDVLEIEQEYVKGVDFKYFENISDALDFNFKKKI